MPRFCPICGQPDSAVSFLGEFCFSCASKKMRQSYKVSITICQRCNSILDRARKKKECTLQQEVLRLLKLKDERVSVSEDLKKIIIQTEAGELFHPLKVSLQKSVCLECGKAASQYFEAIIQLRGDFRLIDKKANQIYSCLQKSTFISKIEHLKEGIDIHVGSRKEAISCLNLLGLGFLRTEKLAGQRQGRRLYRTTLLVRL
ncbi:MAG: NMD3-related protein [Candidatus Anstonellaceae archaeon]